MDAASYGWSASQPVLERLNPPPRVPKETHPKKLHLGSWQRARREAVRREVEVFLKAEERRQAGIKKLLETIHVIDSLDTDFGTFTQFGRSLRGELGVLKRKLKATQKTFEHADGGFLQTYALARWRRIKEAERYEGKGGEVDYGDNPVGISADGVDLGDDGAVQMRLELEQDMRDVELKLGKIWSNDVMLNADLETLFQEAKDIKSACTNTFLNLSIRSNDLHVRLETWHQNIIKIVAALTEEVETMHELEHAPIRPQSPGTLRYQGTVLQGTVDEYLDESKRKVDEIFAAMHQGRAKALEMTEQFADKSAQMAAEIWAENERLQAELLAKEEAHAEVLKAKELELKKAESEASRQRKLLMDDYKRLTLQNEKDIDILSSRYREQLDAANEALEEEQKKAAELAAKLEREREQFKKASRALEDAINERDALQNSIASERARMTGLQAMLHDLQAQLDVADGDNGDGDGRIKVLEEQLRAGMSHFSKGVVFSMESGPEAATPCAPSQTAQNARRPDTCALRRFVAGPYTVQDRRKTLTACTCNTQRG